MGLQYDRIVAVAAGTDVDAGSKLISGVHVHPYQGFLAEHTHRRLAVMMSSMFIFILPLL
jgi:hypothetical protein